MAVIALKCPEINITVVDIDSKKIKAWNGDFDNPQQFMNQVYLKLFKK